jgi:cytochrome c6
LSHPFRHSSLTRFAPPLLASLIPISGIVLAGSVGTAVAQKPVTGAKAKQGETIFKAQCIGCHNKAVGDTTPFGPPNLHGLIGAKPLVTPQEAQETITKGKGAMPSFAGKLTPTDISDVVAYLKTQ